jgi:hypothetical protein
MYYTYGKQYIFCLQIGCLDCCKSWCVGSNPCPKDSIIHPIIIYLNPIRLIIIISSVLKQQIHNLIFHILLPLDLSFQRPSELKWAPSICSKIWIGTVVEEEFDPLGMEFASHLQGSLKAIHYSDSK